MVRGPQIILWVLVPRSSLLRMNFVSENLFLNNRPHPPASWQPPTLEMQEPFPQI